MSPLRALLIAAWTGLVIYPTWGLWAVYLVFMGHLGLRVFFWPLDLYWRKNRHKLATAVSQRESAKVTRMVLYRLSLPFIASLVLMYLSVHWFGWWCFWAIFATFVTFTVSDSATRKA